MPINCHCCKSNITAARKPGVTCAGCQKSFHYNCADITEALKQQYSTGEKIFLCSSCAKKHRNSLSISRLSESPRQATPAPVVPQSSSSEDLVAIIKSLQKAVTDLTEQLKKTDAEVAELKAAKNQPPSVSARTTPTSEPKPVLFTINGIPEEESEETRSIVEKVISAKIANFKLEAATTVKRLPSKSNKSHTILIGVKKGSQQHKDIAQARRGPVSTGGDVGLQCDRIFINESHSTETYNLFRKAKLLKTKGFKFIWITEGRVLIKKEEGGRTTHIKSKEQLDKLLADQ